MANHQNFFVLKTYKVTQRVSCMAEMATKTDAGNQTSRMIGTPERTSFKFERIHFTILLVQSIEIPAETEDGTNDAPSEAPDAAEKVDTVTATKEEADGGEPDALDIEEMKKKVADLEKTAEDLQRADQERLTQFGANAGVEDAPAVEANSIYVGNVDYAVKPEELKSFFSSCGTIQRCTIMINTITYQPRGFGYVEFLEAEAVEDALQLDGQELHGRNIQVWNMCVPFLISSPIPRISSRFPYPNVTDTL